MNFYYDLKWMWVFFLILNLSITRPEKQKKYRERKKSHSLTEFLDGVYSRQETGSTGTF